jgi:hypothetical protein
MERSAGEQTATAFRSVAGGYGKMVFGSTQRVARWSPNDDEAWLTGHDVFDITGQLVDSSLPFTSRPTADGHLWK